MTLYGVQILLSMHSVGVVFQKKRLGVLHNVLIIQKSLSIEYVFKSAFQKNSLAVLHNIVVNRTLFLIGPGC